jgi:transposase
MKTKQSIPKELRYTVRDFDREFPDDDACLEYMAEQRWPGHVTQCAKCGLERKHYRIKGRTAYSCGHCGTQIYPLAGTIFEKTTTPLKTWFYAMYLMGSTRCGISAKQIQRETGVTYKTAWRIFKQVRSLLSEGDLQLEGSTVEMDETYMGGKRHDHPGRPNRADPTHRPVVGMVERGGRVRAFVANDVTRKSLHGFAKEYIMPASTIYTDELPAYHGLDRMNGYRHRRSNHSQGVYVRGDVHTNTIEGFWSLMKRGIGGVYHSAGVSAKHLQSYLDEYCFRYNRRHSGNQQFRAILSRAVERAS